MDDEIIIGKQAIDLHVNGTPIVDIGQQLGKSRQGVQKWIKRYHTIGGDEWYKSISKTPKHIQRKTQKKTENIIVSIRKSF